MSSKPDFSQKSKSLNQLARWVDADLWGKVLFSRKRLFPLFLAIYNPYKRRPANFVLRIDVTKPRKRKKVRKGRVMFMFERRKVAAYYGLTINQLRHLARRSRGTAFYGYENNFLNTLESMLFSLCWRTGFFRNPTHVKSFIRSGNICVNGFQKNSPFFVAVPGDFINFKNLTYTRLFFLVQRKYYRFRDRHFIFNFRLKSLYYLKLPQRQNLFYFAKLDIRTFFFDRKFRIK